MHPVFFKIGSIEIKYYGLLIAAAFIAGTLLGERESQRRGFAPGYVYGFLTYLLLAAIAGARLYYIIFSEPVWFITHPFEIIAIWKGGLALHGGIIGGLLSGIYYCKKKGLPVWQFADILAPSVILGDVVGRVGCTLNGCCYGKPTDLPWGFLYTDPNSQAPLGIPLHPTQIYEIILGLILFSGLYFGRKRIKFDGQLFLTYLMGYGIIRFFIEFFRGDSLILFDHVPMPQVMSVVVFIAGLALYIYRKKKAGSDKVMSNG